MLVIAILELQILEKLLATLAKWHDMSISEIIISSSKNLIYLLVRTVVRSLQITEANYTYVRLKSSFRDCIFKKFSLRLLKGG